VIETPGTLLPSGVMAEPQISATGGLGNFLNSFTAGGGGGGRLALWVSNPEDTMSPSPTAAITITVSLEGGASIIGSSTPNGGAGTIFAPSTGHLICQVWIIDEKLVQVTLTFPRTGTELQTCFVFKQGNLALSILTATAPTLLDSITLASVFAGEQLPVDLSSNQTQSVWQLQRLELTLCVARLNLTLVGDSQSAVLRVQQDVIVSSSFVVVSRTLSQY
jgi:hypothetical protein